MTTITTAYPGKTVFQDSGVQITVNDPIDVRTKETVFNGNMIAGLNKKDKISYTGLGCRAVLCSLQVYLDLAHILGLSTSAEMHYVVRANGQGW